MPWAQSAAEWRAHQEKEAARPADERRLRVGETSNRNLEVLMAERAKRKEFQAKQVPSSRCVCAVVAKGSVASSRCGAGRWRAKRESVLFGVGGTVDAA